MLSASALPERLRSSARPPTPPPDPDDPDWLITQIIGIQVVHDGLLTKAEAHQILDVTKKRPRWLLTQVHPDKHPGRFADASLATSRVNQAMDLCSRHVTEV